MLEAGWHPAARLVCVHWRPAGPERPLTGDPGPRRRFGASRGCARLQTACRARVPARRPGAPMSEPYALLVIGGGPAGLSAARAYRDAGGDGAVAIVADEGRMPYDRPPLTKGLLRGESAEADLPLEDEAWLDEQRVDLISGRAVALDPGRRQVLLSGGRELEYASLPAGHRRRADPAAGARRRPPVGARRAHRRARAPAHRSAGRGDRVGGDRVGLHRLRDRRLAARSRPPGRTRQRRAAAQQRPSRRRRRRRSCATG